MADSLEEAIRKKLGIRKSDDERSSSSDDEDIERSAVLTWDFGSDFKCVAGNDCTYGDPLDQPKGISLSLSRSV